MPREQLVTASSCCGSRPAPLHASSACLCCGSVNLLEQPTDQTLNATTQAPRTEELCGHALSLCGASRQGRLHTRSVPRRADQRLVTRCPNLDQLIHLTH